MYKRKPLDDLIRLVGVRARAEAHRRNPATVEDRMHYDVKERMHGYLLPPFSNIYLFRHFKWTTIYEYF